MIALNYIARFGIGRKSGSIRRLACGNSIVICLLTTNVTCDSVAGDRRNTIGAVRDGDIGSIYCSAYNSITTNFNVNLASDTKRFSTIGSYLCNLFIRLLSCARPSIIKRIVLGVNYVRRSAICRLGNGETING